MVKKPNYSLIYVNTCEFKSIVKIIMATKKWKYLRPRPNRGNGCCHGNRVFEITLELKSLRAFLMIIVYRSKIC